MATLPDLDTTTIGYIAYWNCIDQGNVSDIEPDEVLDSTRINNYTLYDNGIEGRYTSITGREITFRVKEDGWIITYFDRTNTFSVLEGSPIRGYWDIGNDWTSGGSNDGSESDLTQNTLATAINELRQHMSNSDSMDFAFSEVGLYNYEYDTSTNTTLLSHGEQQYDTTFSVTPGFSYTSETVLNFVAAIASSNASVSAGAAFEGVDLTNHDGGDEYGTLDALAQGLVPSAGTEYEHTLTGDGTTYYGSTVTSQGDVVALWE